MKKKEFQKIILEQLTEARAKIELLEAKVNILNNRLFQQETELRLIKKAQ